jgi:hypothetical protein
LLEDLSQKIVSIWNDFYSSDQNWKIDDHTGNALHDLSEIVFTKLDRPFPIYLGTSSCFDRTVNKHRTYHIFVDSTTGCIIIREYKKNDNEQKNKTYIISSHITCSIASDLFHKDRLESNHLKQTLRILFENYNILNKLPDYLEEFLKYGILLMKNVGNEKNIFSIDLQIIILCDKIVNQFVDPEIPDFLWRNPSPPLE